MKLRPTVKKAVNGHRYEALLAEAAECERQRREHASGEAYRLTADRYVREALQNAHSTEQRLDVLEKKLGERTDLRALLLKLEPLVCAANWPQPPVDAWRVRASLRVDSDEMAALATLGSNLGEAFALAVRRVARREPSRFGTCEDPDAVRKELVEVTIRRDALYQQLQVEYTAEDLHFSEPDPQGNTKVSLKLTGGAVAIGPNLGERLVGWFLSQDRP